MEDDCSLPQWWSEMKMELWESPVLSYPLKHTRAGMGFSVGGFITAQRPTVPGTELAVVPYSFAITSHFSTKTFRKLGRSPCCFPKTSLGHQFPAVLSSPQQ